MKIKENVTIYQCEYCEKELKSKHAMIKHESICVNNPKNHKACLNCIHLEQVEGEVYFEEWHYDEGQEKKLMVSIARKTAF